MYAVRYVLLGILLTICAGCTTSNWVVVDEQAVNSAEEPTIVENSTRLVADQEPTVENPVLRLSPYNIVEREYAERVKVQRTVQEYKMKWGFALLSFAGSAVSFLAANTDYVLPGANTSQRIALNATGAMLAVLATTNLEEKGEPIQTDEIRYLRQTGFDIRTDTLRIESFNGEPASITVYNGDDVLLNEPSVNVENEFIEINLAALSSDKSGDITRDSQFSVHVNYLGVENIFSYPATDFLEPYFIVTAPVAQVRSAPSINRDNVISDVGVGSAAPVLSESEQWIEITYNNTGSFIQNSSGRVEWRSAAETGPALLVEVEDIPFGEIDVESAVPVLKARNSNDRAIILSGYDNNQAGANQFSERDERLFAYYMKNALQMADSQIRTFQGDNVSNWTEEIEFCEEMDGGSLHVYLSGYARSHTTGSGPENLALFHINNNDDTTVLPLIDLFDQLSGCTPEKMFVYVDLEYVERIEGAEIISFMNSNGAKQQRLAERLIRNFSNAYVLFGNQVGQSSSAYTGSASDDKRHHIFPYFWAEAIKMRKTRMSELVRHLENNVDYTSRRLHDQPQEVRGFGNAMLDIAE